MGMLGYGTKAEAEVLLMPESNYVALLDTANKKQLLKIEGRLMEAADKGKFNGVTYGY